nr:capsid protein [Haslea ostrearia associated bacilladnavirus]
MAPKRTKSKGRRRRATEVQRRPTPIKRKPTKKTKKSVSGTTAHLLKPLLMPFDRTNMQPKIPDGKVGTSIGQKFTTTREHFNVGAGNIMHALLFPGQSGGLVVIGCQNFGTQPISTPAYNGGGGFTYAHDAVTSMSTLLAKEGYHSWRVVSQAARFELLNAAEEDDGWWEACRVTDTTSMFDYQLVQHDNEAGRDNGTIIPYWLLATFQSKPITDEMTYESGRLKDLHKREFQLHQVKDEVDFTQLCSPTVIEGGNETGIGSPGSPYLVDWNGIGGANNGEKYGMQNYNAIRNYIDFGYDMIYFRFHCRAAATPTRLLTHVVSNQEIQFSSDAGESRYQTLSARVPQAAATLAARANGGKTASVPVQGKDPSRHGG